MTTKKVRKRDGRLEEMDFNKITERVRALAENEQPPLRSINYTTITQKVVAGIPPNCATERIDELVASEAGMLAYRNNEYGMLAGRVMASNLQKKLPSWKETMDQCMANVSPITKAATPLISQETYDFFLKHQEVLEKAIRPERDFKFHIFGMQTLLRSYLIQKSKHANEPPEYLETPQRMMMRVAIGVSSKQGIDAVLNTYELLSTHQFTHATPTLFNAGTTNHQMSSCFLMTVEEDSIDGIYKTLRKCALISKSAGGIGICVSNIRASGSHIRGTNGTSNGLVPMLRVFNDTARYVDQCFDGCTNVLTPNGPCSIKDLRVGDEVISDKGRACKINRVLKHETPVQPEGSNATDDQVVMWDIEIKHNHRPVRVTGTHQVLVLRNQKRGLNHEVIRQRLTSKRAQPEWIDVRDLSMNDFVCFPNMQQNDDAMDDNIYSESDLRFYGLLVGDGWISKGKTPTSANPAGLSVNANATEVRDFIDFYLRDVAGVSTVHESVRDDSCARYVFTFNDYLRERFSMQDLYDANKEKIVASRFLSMSLPRVQSILWGLLRSDGHVPTSDKVGTELTLEMTSAQVIDAAKFILWRCGILCSGYERDRRGSVSKYKNITTKRTTTVLRIPKTKLLAELLEHMECGRFVNYLSAQNKTFSRVTSMKPVPHDELPEYVHDLEVDEDHTYVTELGIVHNGGGKRKGAFTIYLEPWHADIKAYLELRKNVGKEEMRARDLNYALWMPELFMERVRKNQKWSLFCPHEAPGLMKVYGKEFEELYTHYESQPGLAREVIDAQDLWMNYVIPLQIDTGFPNLLYKDAVNRKNNQKNLGTIHCSNLCTEIVEYHDKDEIAVCNLASVALPRFVKQEGDGVVFDHDALYKCVAQVTRNLDEVIDRNAYPVPETKVSNFRHRPIGIGVQGLADVFHMFKLAWGEPDALKLDSAIFETIYYAALDTSCKMAQEVGAPYASFKGSPLSEGKFQFDLWIEEGKFKPRFSGRWNWDALRQRIMKHGVRNSLTTTCMPTASTAQILGNSTSIEPYALNIFTRRVTAGEFIVANGHLQQELAAIGMWNAKTYNELVKNEGSVQKINGIPDDIKRRYLTSFEIKKNALVKHSATRGVFIDQTQSFNIYVENPTPKLLNLIHFLTWDHGLKTGMYYLRTRAANEAIKFTANNNKNSHEEDDEEEAWIIPLAKQQDGEACSRDNPECIACQS